MRYAIISDIHSNLEALEAVLAKISELNAGETFCLGDIVGYNANPNECIDIVKKAGIRCIMGNHDLRASGLEDPGNFTPLAKESVIWTREHLTDESRAFLMSLPRELAVGNFFLFHGSIRDTDRYIIDEDDVQENFYKLQSLEKSARIGFYGHTHVKAAFSQQRGKTSTEPGDELNIAQWKRYLINPGSVGQPRDREPGASFLTYDEAAENVSFYRVDYDIAAAQEKIIEAGLPIELAARLSLGR